MVTVYIVDDSTLLQDRMKELLINISDVKIVGWAKNILEAKQGIQTLKPQVIFLDINLEGSNGLDLLEFLGEFEFKSITIILTNYPRSQFGDHAIKLGADYYLEKEKDFEKIPVILKEISKEFVL